MSDSEEEPYSTIFTSLKHPIRRKILRMLSKNTMTFSQMQEVLEVSNSFLTYHLDNLGELILKTDDGRYKLSSFGEAALATMTKVEDIPATTLHHSTDPKPKRMINRNIALALGTICIILIASLGAAIVYYTMTINSNDATINQLNATLAVQISTIASLNANITNLTNERNQLQTMLNGNVTDYEIQISTLNATIMQLQTWLTDNITAYNSLQSTYTNYVNDHQLTNEQYTDFIDLADSTVCIENETISQPANSYTDVRLFVPYTGYVSVNVTQSTTNTTYVEAIYSAHSVDYDNTITVGTNGTADFPVLTNVLYALPTLVSITLPVINFTLIPLFNFTLIPLFNFTFPPSPLINVAIQINNTNVIMLSAFPSDSTFALATLVPFTNTEIRVGNTDTVGNATETVTITYYY